MNDTAHPPSGMMTYLPTAVAAASLASVLWLLLVSIVLGIMMDRNYREQQRQAYIYPVSGGEKNQTTQVASVIAGVAVLISLLVSLGLIITAFCFWPRHILVGKVLTIASAVLLIPFLCCGVFLGQM